MAGDDKKGLWRRFKGLFNRKKKLTQPQNNVPEDTRINAISDELPEATVTNTNYNAPEEERGRLPRLPESYRVDVISDEGLGVGDRYNEREKERLRLKNDPNVEPIEITADNVIVEPTPNGDKNAVGSGKFSGDPRNNGSQLDKYESDIRR